MFKRLVSTVLGHSIQAQVARFLLIVGLLPLLAVATYLVILQGDSVSKLTNDSLSDQAALQAQSVDRILRSAASDVQILAANPVLRSDTATYQDKSKQIDEAHRFFELFEDISLIDPYGNVIDSTSYGYYGTWLDKSWFQKSLAGESAISDAHIVPSPDRLVVVFTAPVENENGVVAVVVGQMNMRRVWDVLDYAKIGKTGFVVTLDQNGNIISHPNKDMILSKLGGNIEPVGEGTSKIEVDDANGEGSFFGEGASVDVLGWQVFALQNRSELSGPIQNALEKVLLASAVVVAFTIIASLLISKEVTRPVRSLIAGMQNVAEGSFEERVPRGNLKETKALSGAFNRMASNLEESSMRLESAHRELEQRYEELAHARRQAATDSLTGLHNHRWLQEKLQKEVKRSLRYGHSFAVLLMDINGFRLFNETYGHATGDSVLRQTAKLLAATCGKGSFVGRYGGDDFMAILPNTDREGALDIANRIIDAVSASPVRVANGNDLPLALSIGLAVCPEDSRHREELLAIADASLHQAKQTSGSNVAEGQPQQSTLVVYKDTPFRLFDSLVHAVDVKDRYTHSHSQQNAEYAVALGKALDLSEVTLAALRIAGLLHDVGKIGIPDEILMKPGPLTPEEQATMRRHVILSKLIVHGVPNLQDVSDAVYSHHERWDGAGYPRGLKGEEISVAGRIMALVDAYSAMILDRPYRKAMSRTQAIGELEKNAGTQFDPDLVGLFVSILYAEEVEAA